MKIKPDGPKNDEEREYILTREKNTQSAAASLLLFSALPLAIFAIFSVSVAAVSLIGALLFALFWLVVGLLVLGAVLCVTSVLALLVWAWATGTFLVARTTYRAYSQWDERRRQPLPGAGAGAVTGNNGNGHAAVATAVESRVPLTVKKPVPPPPTIKYADEKKAAAAANGNGHEYGAIGRAA